MQWAKGAIFSPTTGVKLRVEDIEYLPSVTAADSPVMSKRARTEYREPDVSTV